MAKANTPASKKAIVGYEGLYDIYSDGRVFSHPQGSNSNIRGKFINPVLPRENGYLRVSLYKNKRPKYYQVSRLVITHFLCEKPFKNAQVNHIDGNKFNNNISNLEWVTPSYNIKHAYQIGLKRADGDYNGRRIYKIRNGLI